jgi:hypothetical protein
VSMVRVDSSEYLPARNIGVGIDLVALHDVFVRNFLAGISIHLHVFDATTRFFIDLVKADTGNVGPRPQISAISQTSFSVGKFPICLSPSNSAYMVAPLYADCGLPLQKSCQSRIAAAAFSTCCWHDVPATLQADDPELWQRIFCEPCREIIILFAVVSKFKPPQS